MASGKENIEIAFAMDLTISLAFFCDTVTMQAMSVADRQGLSGKFTAFLDPGMTITAAIHTHMQTKPSQSGASKLGWAFGIAWMPL